MVDDHADMHRRVKLLVISVDELFGIHTLERLLPPQRRQTSDRNMDYQVITA